MKNVLPMEYYNIYVYNTNGLALFYFWPSATACSKNGTQFFVSPGCRVTYIWVTDFLDSSQLMRYTDYNLLISGIIF